VISSIYNTYRKKTIIKPIGLNVHKTPPHCSYVTLCMLFTVHKKLSVAHTGDFHHTNYTFKKITLLYHPTLSISKKEKKRNPYLPYLLFYFFWGGRVACHRNQAYFLFGLTLFLLLGNTNKCVNHKNNTHLIIVRKANQIIIILKLVTIL